MFPNDPAEQLYLVGYLTRPSEEMWAQYVPYGLRPKLAPEFSAPSNYGAEAAAKYVRQKQEQFAGEAQRLPYLADLREVAITCLPTKQKMDDGLSPIFYTYGKDAAQHLCRHINRLAARIAIIAFDVRTLVKVLATECAARSYKLPQYIWFGSNENLDMEHILVPRDFPGLSLQMALTRLGMELPEDYAPGKKPMADLYACMQGLVQLNLFSDYHPAIDVLAAEVRNLALGAEAQEPAAPAEAAVEGAPEPIEESAPVEAEEPAAEPVAAAPAVATASKVKKVFRPRPRATS